MRFYSFKCKYAAYLELCWISICTRTLSYDMSIVDLTVNISQWKNVLYNNCIRTIYWLLLEWNKNVDMKANLCRCFSSLVYIYIAVGDPNIKKGRFWIPLTGSTLPHFCAYPKPGPVFPTPYVRVFWCVSY
jgi:hypothetical protein